MLLFVTALATKHLIALCQAAIFLYPFGQGCFTVTLLINPLSPSDVQSGNKASPAVKTQRIIGFNKTSGIHGGYLGIFLWRWKIENI